MYFFFVALTAPAFGAATTTAAAPATGFSFGSTNTGEMIFTFVEMYFFIFSMVFKDCFLFVLQ